MQVLKTNHFSTSGHDEQYATNEIVTTSLLLEISKVEDIREQPYNSNIQYYYYIGRDYYTV